MADSRQEALHLAAAEVYRGHYALALQYYDDRTLDKAITHYKSAADLADKCSFYESAIHCRCMVGICLMQLGRLMEALTELSRFLDRSCDRNSPRYVFTALTTYIQAAQRLPVTLDTINRAYREADDLLRSSGHTGWRHELLVHRARLELSRGEAVAALAAAQEAAALKCAPSNDGTVGQVWDFHYDGLVDIALLRSDTDSAEHYIEEWLTRPDRMPTNRRIRRARCLSDLRRFQRRHFEAATLAETALEAAKQTDYTEVRAATFRSFIRSRLMLGNLLTARAALAAYAKDVRSESKLDRYAYFLMLGDYHLTAARQAANIQLADDQFSWDEPMSERTSPPTDLNQPLLVSAMRAYRKAAKVASYVDAKLQSEVHTREISGRIARCTKLSVKSLQVGS